MVDIRGLDKARVLKALYDHGRPHEFGFVRTVPDGTVTVEYCEKLLKNSYYFDCLHGRVLKVKLSGDAFDECLYDRYCGAGAAQRAVDSVREEMKDSGKEQDKNLTDKQVKDTVDKILAILEGQPVEISIKASVVLLSVLADALTTHMFLSELLKSKGGRMPPVGGAFGTPFLFKGRFG